MALQNSAIILCVIYKHLATLFSIANILLVKEGFNKSKRRKIIVEFS